MSNRDEAEIRERFMAIVYDELTEDGTNDRANRIIGAFDDAETGLTADLAAMTAERDAAQQYIRDMLYDATLLVDSAMCDFCACWENELCWAGDCKADCKWRGPTATASSTPPQPSQPTQPPPQAAQAPEPDA